MPRSIFVRIGCAVLADVGGFAVELYAETSGDITANTFTLAVR